MKNPEFVGLVVLVAVAIVAVRLVIQPAQRNKFTLELLEHLVDCEPGEESVSAAQRTALPAGDLQECLLRHFEKFGMSQRILGALADSEKLTQKDLDRVLDRTFAEKGRPPLPVAVSRRVAMILLHAGLPKVEAGVPQITAPGRHLNQLLQTRTPA